MSKRRREDLYCLSAVNNVAVHFTKFFFFFDTKVNAFAILAANVTLDLGRSGSSEDVEETKPKPDGSVKTENMPKDAFPRKEDTSSSHHAKVDTSSRVSKSPDIHAVDDHQDEHEGELQLDLDDAQRPPLDTTDKDEQMTSPRSKRTIASDLIDPYSIPERKHMEAILSRSKTLAAALKELRAVIPRHQLHEARLTQIHLSPYLDWTVCVRG